MHSSSADILTIQQKLEYYKIDATAVDLLQHTSIVLLVGISGAGKDTVKHELLQKPDYHHIVSHTTRASRRNHGVMEQNGVEYHFIDLPTAEKMLDNHAFIEAKMYSDNVYGTSVAEIKMAHDEGKIAITDLEVQGVEEYVALSGTVKPVFILPPSYAIWRQRFFTRYGDHIKGHEEDIQKRMQTARDELQHVSEQDYFYLVVNDKLDDTVKTIDSIAHGDVSANESRTETVMHVMNDLIEGLNKQLNEKV